VKQNDSSCSACHATHSLNRNKQSYSWSLSFDLRQMATHVAKLLGADNVTLFSSGFFTRLNALKHKVGLIGGRG
jgi:hypothetical protein